MSNDTADRRSESWTEVLRPLLRVFAGFGVWSLCFVSLYGLQAVLCPDMLGLSPAVGQASLLVVWLLYVALLSFMLLRGLGEHRAHRLHRYNFLLLDEAAYRFLRRLMVIVDAAALAAVVLTGLPVVFIKACV